MFANEVHRHVPLAAVSDWVAQQEGDGAVVEIAVRGFEDRFQKMVRALELVPEMDVRLTEFEILDVEFLHRAGSEKVQHCEEPATAAAHLMGDLPGVEFEAE